MTLYWIYDLPNWMVCLLIVGSTVGVALAGLGLSRGLVARLVGPPPGADELVSYFLSAYGVLYGLALGLIAVATWQNFFDVEALVDREATVLATLYRDVSGYPEPPRSALQEILRDDTDYTIGVAWPEQESGRIPPGAMAGIAALQEKLTAFEPATRGQEVLHAETLRAFNALIEARQDRLHGVMAGLPQTVWWVLLSGALLNVGLTLLFNTARRMAHAILVTILAGYIGLLVFFIAAMDNPFRGEFSISAQAFELVRDGVMTPRATPR